MKNIINYTIEIVLFLLLTACGTTIPLYLPPVDGHSINIAGEVNRPGIYKIPNERFSVTEALAMAGDMTVFGMRNKIKVIRPGINGKLHIHTLNLDHDNVWTSAYFTLKPGDVIYVAPNKAKTDSANIGKKSTLWVSILSSFISIGGLLIKMLKL